MLKAIKDILRDEIRSGEKANNSLLSWRERIYNSLMKALVIIGLIAYMPSVIFSILGGFWVIAILDTAVYILIILIFALKKIPFHIRVYGLLFIIYLLGVVLLIMLGQIGAGWIWLFAFPVFASILKGFRASLTCILINVITLAVLAYMIHAGTMNGFLIGEYDLGSWIIVSINFICLNGLVSIPIAVILNALELTLEEEEKVKLLITEQKEVLNEKNKDLIRINSDLDNFIYITSHDLKSPISNLQGLLSALDEELSTQSEVSVKIISLMKQSVEKFRSVIDSLSVISQAQQPEAYDGYEDYSMLDVLDDVKFNLSTEIEKYAPIIKTDFKIQKINFSKKDLTSILQNLIGNAMKYSDPQKKCEITIVTEKSGDNIVIEVKDNGLGIKPAHQEKIFMMFKRMHDHVEGTGIGLYLIKRIVENHGGTIEVESDPGKGSTFRVLLKEQGSLSSLLHQPSL
ncbi:MAG: sensor histidine kinase [Cytophagaceae bacterium]